MAAHRVFISLARGSGEVKTAASWCWAGANLTTNHGSPDRVRMPGP